MTMEELKQLVLPVATEAERAALAAEETAVNAGNKTIDEMLAGMAGLLARSAKAAVAEAMAATRQATQMPAPSTTPASMQTADLIQGLTEALKSIQRPHRVEHFSGSKSENAEQWLRKFEIAAKANGWINDPILMSDQFLCHLKSPASDWFQEQETMITGSTGSTWENAEALFLERFRRSVISQQQTCAVFGRSQMRQCNSSPKG